LALAIASERRCDHGGGHARVDRRRLDTPAQSADGVLFRRRAGSFLEPTFAANRKAIVGVSYMCDPSGAARLRERQLTQLNQ
jgi:hypothetical protein